MASSSATVSADSSPNAAAAASLPQQPATGHLSASGQQQPIGGPVPVSAAYPSFGQQVMTPPIRSYQNPQPRYPNPQPRYSNPSRNNFFPQPNFQPRGFQNQPGFFSPSSSNIRPPYGSVPPYQQNFSPSFVPPYQSLPTGPLPHMTQAFTVRLSDSNYLLWKNQLINLIWSQGLEGFINGTIQAPPAILDNISQQPNPEYTLWEKYNRTVMSWLYASLTEEKIGEVVSLSTARDIWESLRRSYESTSSARLLSLKAQLSRVRKDGLSITQYLAKIKDITDKLASIGEPVPLKDHISYVLEGLGAEYNAFVTSIQHRSELPPIEDVRALLLSYEYRLECQSSVDIMNVAQANLAGLNLSSNQSSRRGSRHTPSNAKSRQPMQSQQGLSSPNFTPVYRGIIPTPPPPPVFYPPYPCQICYKDGHTAFTCYHRPNLKYQQPPIPPHLKQPPHALYASAVPHDTEPHPQPDGYPPQFPEAPVPDEAWFLDSGATHHLTPDLNSLANPVAYHGGEQVTVGNGPYYQESSSSGHP